MTGIITSVTLTSIGMTYTDILIASDTIITGQGQGFMDPTLDIMDPTLDITDPNPDIMDPRRTTIAMLVPKCVPQLRDMQCNVMTENRKRKSITTTTINTAFI